MQVKAFSFKTLKLSNAVADVFKIHEQRRDRKTTLNLLTPRLNQEGLFLPPDRNCLPGLHCQHTLCFELYPLEESTPFGDNASTAPH